MAKQEGGTGWRIGKVLLGILLCIAVAAGIFCAVRPKAAKAVFYNLFQKRVELPAGEWDGGESYEKLPYADYSENCWLDLYVPRLENPDEKPPLFVLIHGGGFIYNDARSRQALFMVRSFRNRGFAVASVNYRLAQEAPHPGAIQDCQAAIRFLKAHADEYGYDASRPAVWGESAGGFLASTCAFAEEGDFEALPFIGEEDAPETTAKVCALVDYYGTMGFGDSDAEFRELGIPPFIVSLANSWLETDVTSGFSSVHEYWLRHAWSDLSPEEQDRFQPLYYAKKNMNSSSDMAVYIAHGDCDITVPYLESVKLSQCLEEAGVPVTLHIAEHCGHAADAMYAEEELDLVETFLREALQGSRNGE